MNLRIGRRCAPAIAAALVVLAAGCDGTYAEQESISFQKAKESGSSRSRPFRGNAKARNKAGDLPTGPGPEARP